MKDSKNKKTNESLGLGIDLGTTNLLVYLEKKGIIFNEPSVIAFDNETGKTVAAGMDAHKMLGKVHRKITVVKPLRDGVISDMNAAKSLLQYVFRKVEDFTFKDLSKSTCVMCCPSEVTEIERDVMIDLAKNMGITDMIIEEEVKAGALGAGVDIFKSKGVMIVDIGGGTTDVGVISFGGIVLSRTIRMAGNFMDDALALYTKKEKGVEIGELTSEKCKITLSDLNAKGKVSTGKYAGRDIIKGVPKYFDITSEEVYAILLPAFEEIVKLITAVLKDTPPELSADIFENGILLTGGGSLVKGLEQFLSDRLNVPVNLVANPLTCVAEGSKYLLKNRGNYLINPLQL